MSTGVSPGASGHLTLIPARILPAVTRNDIPDRSYDFAIDEYVLDCDWSSIRHIYATVPPGSEQRAYALTEKLRLDRLERPDRFVAVQALYHGDFHKEIQRFLQSDLVPDPLKSQAEQTYARLQSIGGLLQAFPELRSPYDEFEAMHMADNIEHQLAAKGCQVGWESWAMPDDLSWSVFTEDTWQKIGDLLDGDERMQHLVELRPGDVCRGVIGKLEDVGAFVEVGCPEKARLHITDMTYGYISHPSELVRSGQELELKVLNVDPGRGRIEVGIKQLKPHPWQSAAQKYPVGSRVQGRVVSITNYGAFVELEPGVQGLVRIKDMLMPAGKARHPSKIVSVGEEIEVTVLKVEPYPTQENPHEKKIFLGMERR